MSAFSIIICAHNPEKNIFNRLINAIQSFDENETPFEVIIVDNNCKEKIADFEEVKSLKKNISTLKVIEEKNPGLTNARIAGIKEAKYDWIIFFDDDNEPSKDYLIEAAKFILENPKIGICGPGHVSVEFMHNNRFTKTERIKKLFQNRKTENELIDNNLFSGNNDAFPYGTGMIVQKVILEEYSENVNNGIYTLTDRRGKSLSSAGDTQILYLALKMSYYSGTSPNLKLNHIISEKKLTKQALINLFYSIHTCHIKAYNEVFLDKKIPIKKPSDLYCILLIFGIIKNRIIKRGDTGFLFNISETLGMQKSQILAGNFKNLKILSLWEKYWGI